MLYHPNTTHIFFLQMPQNGASVPPVAPLSSQDKTSTPAPTKNTVKQAAKSESTESKLSAMDMAAMDSMFAALDDNYKTSYDLSQMTSQVTLFHLYIYAYLIC